MKAEGGCYEGNCRDEGRGEGQYRWVGTRGVKSIRRASFKEQHGQGQQKTNMARNMREGGGGGGWRGSTDMEEKAGKLFKLIFSINS